MTLPTGTRLGPYEVLAPIGAGGMGEVYRARDAKLGRDVAIKVLPEAFAADVERLARFRREAQVLASLAHPNVAHIYGVEEASGVDALVLELVEGETLAERIARGPLPVDEALDFARQIADALEAAHEKGIVHRDLKPANVKITPQGKVKVLDFGLAKAIAGDPSSPDATQSPTITAAATQAGVVIGTAAYMSPEQARGRSVDKRSDIWAFGAVVYEMLTGRKAFEGETISDTLAAVLRADVDWSGLPSETPASVRRVLKRCLDRDIKTRFHDVADARIAMDETPEAPTAAAPAVAAPPVAGKRSAVWPALAAVLLALAALGWWRALATRTPARTGAVTRLAFLLPAGDALPYEDHPVFALSRDGRALVYVAERDGATRLNLRTFEAPEARALEGTSDAHGPFFSPDGRWIGFFQEGKLKKIPVDGGTAVTLADAPTPRGGAWLEDDSIVYSPQYTSGLWRVAARGGAPEELTTLDAAGGERTHRWPEALPGGRLVLFTVGSARAPSNYESAEVAVVEVAARKRRKVFDGGSMPRFVPPDRLVFVRGNTVLAVHFDPSAAAVTGDAALVVDKVGGDTSGGAAFLATAWDGTLAYAQGAFAPRDRTLVLVDRNGQANDVPLSPRLFQAPRFSPDGKGLAFSVGSGGGADDDVFAYDLSSNVLTRLTFNNTGISPAWSADGKRIAYGSIVGGREGVWTKRADGSGAEEPIETLKGGVEFPTSWSEDGRWLAVTRASPTVGVWLVAAASGEKSREVVPGATAASLSPDGRFLAYGTGYYAIGAVFVQPSDGSPGKWQITTDKGGFPVWRGKEIFFVREGGDVWAVDVETSPTFRAGTPHLVFKGEGKYTIRSAPLSPFDASSDGKRFVLIRSLKTDAANSIDVVLNWPAETSRGVSEKR